jgi:hypothetical protein
VVRAHDVLEKDADGNVARGDVVLEGCKDSYVLSTSCLVAAIGLEDFVVIETADAVAVLPRHDAQRSRLCRSAEALRQNRGSRQRTAGRAPSRR